MNTLFAQTEEISTIATVGSVRSAIGATGKLIISPNNMLNPEKAVMITLVNEQNQKQKVFCSKAVSEGLRNKTITMGELMTMGIAPGTTSDGVEIFRIIRPEGEQVVINGADLKDKEYKPKAKVAVPTELVAY